MTTSLLSDGGRATTPERILREAIRRYRKAPPGKKQQRFHEMRRANLEALKAAVKK